MPAWLRGQNRGWITAEYGMLPRATTQVRVPREAKETFRTDAGNSARLIGRSLRAVVDLTKMKDISLCVDCDVIPGQTAGRVPHLLPAVFVALSLAIDKLLAQKD